MRIAFAIAASAALGLLSFGPPTFAQDRGARPEASRGQRERPRKEVAAPPRDMKIEEQEDAPVRLLFAGAWAVPGHAHLVELEFTPQDAAAKRVKSFAVHSYEALDDGHVSHSMNFAAPVRDDGEPRKVSFKARRDGRVRVWVAAVEYEDGTSWKSKITEAAREWQQ